MKHDSDSCGLRVCEDFLEFSFCQPNTLLFFENLLFNGRELEMTTDCS